MADDPAPLGRSPAGRERRNGYLWLAGDHHVHTRHSPETAHRVADQIRHANAYGLDWMAVTDRGRGPHTMDDVEQTNADILVARRDVKDTLVFHGLEWNIPAAGHGTVLVHPGWNEVAVLRTFERFFDGVARSATAPGPDNEALAVAGVRFLADAVTQRRIQDALLLVNHPARRGVNSPHQIRGWRDAGPRIAVGFEGAPGHQAAGIAAPAGQGSARGNYVHQPSAVSFPGYPAESYRTWGGFDWMTATVGGLWDSMLAEGRPWWITANSDSHRIHDDSASHASGGFWPGFFSRTHVGATDFAYAAIMAGLRAGRSWVDHGGLIRGLDVRVRSGRRWATLGDTLIVRRGSPVELTITIDLANGPNWAQFVPSLARVDVIRGAVTGPAADRDAFAAAQTSVAKTFDINRSTGVVAFGYPLGTLDEPFYVRLRGTDGNRGAPGCHGASVDPVGPAMDVVGGADPWTDLWFYTNPIWVLPK
ncbi:MAG: PHP domain-containing protein [Dactylosporangium sp.]|nr:PHP domain-containing protein [Dactylosporangium sp.]